MRRREFIILLGGATALPLSARAQQKSMPVIGFLNGGSAEKWRPLVEAFRRGLADFDFTEGQNVTIDYRWAEGQWDRLPAMATDLVSRNVAVIVAGGGDGPALAAKAATSTIPIVYTSGGDPIKSGLVASLSRPGGNVTGITSFTFVLGPKRLEILGELVHPKLIAVLANTDDPPAAFELEQIKSAAQTLNIQIIVLPANTESEIRSKFTQLDLMGAGALLVGSGAFFTLKRDQLVQFSAEHRIPAIYQQREFVEAGGLISYGISFIDQYRKLGGYTGRVLRGERPADLPVAQPAKFEMVINLKTAGALGLAVPQLLLAQADEVIE